MNLIRIAALVSFSLVAGCGNSLPGSIERGGVPGQPCADFNTQRNAYSNSHQDLHFHQNTYRYTHAYRHQNACYLYYLHPRRDLDPDRLQC